MPYEPYEQTERTAELQEEILQRLAEGETLSSICRDLRANEPGCLGLMPNRVRKWSRDYEDFGLRYRQAIVDGADALADQAHELADKLNPTEIITEKWRGKKLLERQVRIVDNIERTKLQVLVRQWRARVGSPHLYNPATPLSLKADPDENGSPVLRVEVVGGLPAPGEQKPADLIPVASVEDPPELPVLNSEV